MLLVEAERGRESTGRRGLRGKEIHRRPVPPRSAHTYLIADTDRNGLLAILDGFGFVVVVRHGLVDVGLQRERVK